MSCVVCESYGVQMSLAVDVLLVPYGLLENIYIYIYIYICAFVGVLLK